MNQNIQMACAWFCGDHAVNVTNPETACSFRDVFQAKIDKMHSLIIKNRNNASEAALITALIGEIGNNCFDHNLGHWRDAPGCWFDYDMVGSQVWCIVADRGRGIYNSLLKVCPELNTEQQALEIAYSKTISGRYPERRGNGLKFVSTVVNGSKMRGLFCRPGSGELTLGQMGLHAKKRLKPHLIKTQNFGTLVFILWEG